MSNAKLVLGIDLRQSSIKIVEIETKDGEVTLKNWALAELPHNVLNKHPDREESQIKTLKQVIRERKIKTKKVVVVVGGGDLFFKIYTLTNVAEPEVLEALKWKCAEELTFPIEEAVLDFYALTVLDPKAQTRDYLVACINQKLFKEIDLVISKAGLSLEAVTVVPDVLCQVFQANLVAEKDSIVSLIYMGQKATNITILKKGAIEFNRELDIGGDTITQAMTGVLVSGDSRIEIGPAEAEKIKIEHGVPVEIEKYPQLKDVPISQLQAMVRPTLERIVEEIQRTFEYYKGQSGEAAINKIIFTGGAAQTKNLATFLSESLGVSVEVPAVLSGIKLAPTIKDKTELEAAAHRLSAALGAALLGPTKINLLPKEVKEQYQLLAQRILSLQYVLSLVVILLGLWYFGIWLEASKLGQESARLKGELQKCKPRIEQMQVLEKLNAEQKARQGEFLKYRDKEALVLQAFAELSRLTPTSMFISDLSLDAVSGEAVEYEVKILGTVFDKKLAAENILSQYSIDLATSRYFYEVKMVQAIKNDSYVQDAYDYEIAAKVKN
ncbi:hypothetical protein COT42_09010 [Candidatus Saganbacteria bacterium CG08_land_8_20_14_0_20_45_16]|uniref:SHS2 domain-containing protein n=1 Tax=Candidatus Saganbacteria bacterium CG08_land_8_20_14_0_20_45_16 TaxID=2014293 RepID=A0A2H0XTD4_UNCSA|nr:MAG: hypothetical protein COT42_09010 [Candidatus Saganbacteria bacterium CG08_land_8_20_14_0_20_45_16]